MCINSQTAVEQVHNMQTDDKLYQSLLEIFKVELKEGHQAIIDALIKIEVADEETLQTLLKKLFRTTHNIKGAAKSVSLDKIATLAHKLEDQFSEWRDKHYKPNKLEIEELLKATDKLLTFFEESTDRRQNRDILKIPLEKIERANTKVDEFITYKLRFENWRNKLNQIYQLSRQSKIVSMDQFETIVTNVNAQINKLSEDSSQFLGEFSRSLQDLQDELREMRLLPIETILAPLRRTAHELAESMQKNVALEIEGDDVEMDKPILDLIKDPMLHLLRNSIDHGIETPLERKKENKPEQGTIRISIIQESGTIKIIFKDNGRGINTAELKKKALKELRFSEENLHKMSHQELLELIFLPGFSTSKTVTEVSGRGVGLDVVLNQIEKAKGRIELDSEEHKGTTFTLYLPLTMAKTRGIFVKVDEQAFMLPSLSISSLHEIPKIALNSVETELVYTLHNMVIPVRFLNELLQIKMEEVGQKNFQGILLGDRQNQFMILVDEIENEHDCVIKSLPAPFNQLNLYVGVTLTGSSELVPILNPKSLTELAQQQTTHKTFLQEKPLKKVDLKTILVVDDSLTTRSLVANALRIAGFDVTTLGDGRAAWNLLQKNHFDCVVTDIEMPYMDGFELTKLIKSNSDLKNLPLIIVSSHESEEEKRIGIEYGADAYLVKSQFNTKSLVDMIESLI